MASQQTQSVAETILEYAEAVWNQGRTAFPDLEVETTSVIVGAEEIVSQWVATGTHEGEMADLGIEPTMKTVTWEGVTIYGVDGDVVTEAWWYYDQFGMLTQLGVIPEPSA